MGHKEALQERRKAKMLCGVRILGRDRDWSKEEPEMQGEQIRKW